MAKGRHAWQPGHMRGKEGYAWQRQGVCGKGGACMAGAWQRGTCVARGACVQEKRPLKRAVRILLECNLVRIIFVFPTQICFSKCFLDTLMYYMLNIVFYQ